MCTPLHEHTHSPAQHNTIQHTKQNPEPVRNWIPHTQGGIPVGVRPEASKPHLSKAAGMGCAVRHCLGSCWLWDLCHRRGRWYRTRRSWRLVFFLKAEMGLDDVARRVPVIIVERLFLKVWWMHQLAEEYTKLLGSRWYLKPVVGSFVYREPVHGSRPRPSCPPT